MSYLSPVQVTAPKDQWHLDGGDVIYDGGENGSSIAFGTWNGRPCLAARWNGSLNDERAKKGNPISRFQPTWFVLPLFVASATMRELLMLEATGAITVNLEALRRAIQATQSES